MEGFVCPQFAPDLVESCFAGRVFADATMKLCAVLGMFWAVVCLDDFVIGFPSLPRLGGVDEFLACS